jgi:hypothetical protein
VAETSANSEAQEGKLGLKDIAILVPTLGTAMAVVWEIARLMPFGGFTYFSLTDHLLAAFQALPFAIALAALVGSFYGLAVISFGKKAIEEWSELVENYHVPKLMVMVRMGLDLIVVCCFIGVFVAAGVAFWDVVLIIQTLKWPAWGITGTSVPLVVFFFAGPNERRSKLEFYITLISAVIVLTVAVALDVSHYQVARSSARQSTITLKSGPLQAVVLMTGDRGLLLYDPASDHVTYHRFDDVEKIDWARPSVWDWLAQ